MSNKAFAAFRSPAGGAEWAYRGFVAATHPSEVMPLSWPEPPSGLPAVAPPGFAQIGVSLEPLGEWGAGTEWVLWVLGMPLEWL